jgi:hypothetical protein
MKSNTTLLLAGAALLYLVFKKKPAADVAKAPGPGSGFYTPPIAAKATAAAKAPSDTSWISSLLKAVAGLASKGGGSTGGGSVGGSNSPIQSKPLGTEKPNKLSGDTGDSSFAGFGFPLDGTPPGDSTTSLGGYDPLGNPSSDFGTPISAPSFQYDTTTTQSSEFGAPIVAPGPIGYDTPYIPLTDPNFGPVNPTFSFGGQAPSPNFDYSPSPYYAGYTPYVAPAFDYSPSPTYDYSGGGGGGSSDYVDEGNND